MKSRSNGRNGRSKHVSLGDAIRLRGSIEVQLQGVNGHVDERRFVHNTVVTSGRAWVLQRIRSGGDTNTIGFCAVGTSTTAPTTGDTALGSESTRKAIGTFDTTNVTSNPPSWVAQTSFATNEANTTLGETGLFNSSSGGTMLAHATFATINKTTSNTLQINYTISN